MSLVFHDVIMVALMDRDIWEKHRQRQEAAAEAARTGAGPELTFAASMLACVAAWGAMHHTLEAALIRPAVTTLIFALAAVLAIAFWRRKPNPNKVTYTDVAGALTLTGICMAATIDPHEFIQIMFSESSAVTSSEPVSQRRDS
jgi:hypothetical protein